MANKSIDRKDQDAGKIFDNRSLKKDYRTLSTLLKKGLRVLDVGCGTGAITKDIALIIGDAGHITGIDNTEGFITSGKTNYGHVQNLSLIHSDLFEFSPTEKFDLIISARTLQWLSHVPEAITKMKSMIKPRGTISILDYDHTLIEWVPSPPESMRQFYQTFLKWRSDAGMNNQIARDLASLLTTAGFQQVKTINADEHYEKSNADFKPNAGIWSKVAASRQMVTEGYLQDDLRLKAIEEYNNWIENTGLSMTMKLNEVRGVL